MIHHYPSSWKRPSSVRKVAAVTSIKQPASELIICIYIAHYKQRSIIFIRTCTVKKLRIRKWCQNWQNKVLLANAHKSCNWNAIRNLIPPHFGLASEICIAASLIRDRHTLNDNCKSLQHMRRGLINAQNTAGRLVYGLSWQIWTPLFCSAWFIYMYFETFGSPPAIIHIFLKHMDPHACYQLEQRFRFRRVRGWVLGINC